MPTDIDCYTRFQDYYATHDILPSYARIGELLGMRCIWGVVTSSAHSAL
jgi:hypothetical protein